MLGCQSKTLISDQNSDVANKNNTIIKDLPPVFRGGGVALDIGGPVGGGVGFMVGGGPVDGGP